MESPPSSPVVVCINQKLEGVELRQAKMMQEGFESIDRKITQANKVLRFREGSIAV